MIKMVLIILLLLFFSGLFSASESAYFTININRLRNIKTKGKSKKYILLLLSEKERLLSTILIGNLIVNIFYFSFTSEIVFRLSEESTLKGTLAVMTYFIVLLIFGEILPKTIAINIPYKMAKFSSWILVWFFHILYPVNIIIRYLLLKTRYLTDWLLKGRDQVIGDELNYILNFTHKDGHINLKEKFMLFGGVDFDQLKVKSFMTPRMKVAACDVNVKKEGFIKLFREGRHSNIVVYDNDIENTLGYVSAKELYFSEDFDLPSKIRRFLYIPELTQLRKAYSIFSRYGLKIAAVVDEYGGFQGIITNEDIIEAIIGDIDDEFITKASPILEISDTKFSVSGDISIRFWNMHFPRLPDSDDVDTLAGYLEMVSGCIPRKGDDIVISKIRFTILEVSKIRIQRIMVELQ